MDSEGAAGSAGSTRGQRISDAIRRRAAQVRERRTWSGLFEFVVFAVAYDAWILMMVGCAVTHLGELLLPRRSRPTDPEMTVRVIAVIKGAYDRIPSLEEAPNHYTIGVKIARHADPVVVQIFEGDNATGAARSAGRGCRDRTSARAGWCSAV